MTADTTRPGEGSLEEPFGVQASDPLPMSTPAGPSMFDVPSAPTPAPASTSTELVPVSRRALREAERSAPSSRRSRRTAPAESVPPRRPDAAPVARAAAPITPAAARPAHGPRPSLRRRIAEKTFPPVVMLAAASLLVGTSVPANALFDPDAPPASVALSSIPLEAAASSDAAIPEDQVLEAEASDELAATAASRDEWSVTSYAEMLRLKYGNRNFSYSTTGTGAVRWPFPVAVPISSGFGERVAPCRWCSSYHQGIDFNPGAGTAIFAIADGVVLQAEYSGGFGQHALIEHTINGQRVVSVYAHMIGGSSPLVVGETVEAGDFVGLVGSTGTSTGAHLHFEIRIDDIAIDPFDWLTANAS